MLYISQKDLLEELAHSKKLANHLFNVPLSDSRHVPTNIAESDSHLTVTMEVPGLSKEDIQIDFLNHVLHIKSSVSETSTSSDSAESVMLNEIPTRSFSRAFEIGDVDFEKARASVSNGILSISIPKSAAQQPRTLAID